MIEFLFVFFLGGVLGANIKGVLDLDSWTFDKVIDGTRTALVKFDKNYADGASEDEFKEFAKRVGEMGKQSADLLVAEVGKTDYMQKKNFDLHERFGVQSDDLPVFKLFKKGSLEPVSFKDTVDAQNLSRFVLSEAGVWIGTVGCLEKFDKLMTNFMEQKDKRETILSEATSLQKGMDKNYFDSAKTYIRIMKKIMRDGDSFIKTEIKRVEKLKEGKLSDAKKELFQRRLNILGSFKAGVVKKRKVQKIAKILF